MPTTNPRRLHGTHLKRVQEDALLLLHCEPDELPCRLVDRAVLVVWNALDLIHSCLVEPTSYFIIANLLLSPAARGGDGHRIGILLLHEHRSTRRERSRGGANERRRSLRRRGSEGVRRPDEGGGQGSRKEGSVHAEKGHRTGGRVVVKSFSGISRR